MRRRRGSKYRVPQSLKTRRNDASLHDTPLRSRSGGVRKVGAVGSMDLGIGSARKRPVFFGDVDRPLFGFYHPPGDGPRRGTGIVLCAPIGTDHSRSHRTYRHLAERLAAAGFPCMRFDLYGNGDSGGDEFTPGLARGWTRDVAAAREQLRSRSGVQSVALVGLRIGATVAMMHAAERGDVDALVLWNPCVSGASFVSEVSRLHQIYVRLEPQLGRAPPSRVSGEEALGSFLPEALISELREIDLLETARLPAHKTLFIDGGNVAGRDALVGRLRDLGAEVEVQSHPGHKFLVTVAHRSLVPESVIESIVGWLGRIFTATGAVAPAIPCTMPTPPANERPIVFGRSHPLFGILTPADPKRASAQRADRPRIVLSNAGCVHRCGPHRIYVKMARRWAQMGFDVLRVDLTGIGDSPAVTGQQENVTYPPSGLEDLREAIRSLGSGRVIIAGLCSGGDYAFQLGAHDPNVAGAWLLNPRTFGVLALAAVESGAPPTTPVDDVPLELRRMAERGIDTVLVVSRNDPGVAYVDRHAGDAMAALEGIPHFRRVDLDGADHSFTPMATQESVSDLLTDHLAKFAVR
jgi:dienelactone hydrolase